jgi:hypothetical protein
MRDTGTLTLLRRPGTAPEVPPDREVHPAAWRSALPIVGGLAVILGLGFLVGTPRRQTAELRQLPNAVRTNLYQGTLHEVKSICTLPAAMENGVVRDHCVAQAQFVLTFPECDQDCGVAARAVLPHAHR